MKRRRALQLVINLNDEGMPALRRHVAERMAVEQPRAFELAVNLKAAREQGITIPKSILLHATRVIE